MAKFNIITQFLKDFSFESPNVPELFFKQDNGQAKMEINIDIQIKGAENNLFMVDLITKIHSKLENGVWEGGSVSMFTPVLKFTLFERFSKDCLEVTESMEMNGKRTFGFDEPIRYKRT